MKICIVSEYYKPDNFLINEITPELVKAGHEVTVLTGLPDYSTGKIPKEYRCFRRRHEIIDGVEVIRVPTIARRKGFVFRILNYLSFMLSSGVFSLFWGKKFDIVLTYQLSPITQVLAGKVIKWKQKAPHIIYCLDLWPASVNAWGFFEGSVVFKIAHSLSKWAYKHADCIAVSSRPFIDYLVKTNNLLEEGMVYLPQHSPRMKEAATAKRSTTDEVNLIFAGNIGSVQNVECLIRAVALVQTERNYQVHIYGDGSRCEDCKRLSKSLATDSRIVFHGRVPRSKLDEIYPKMDGLLLTLASEKTAGAIATTVPAKFQNYLSTGKPIIASIDGGAAEIIKQIDCGLVAPADDEEALAEIIKKFVENPSGYSKYGERGVKYFNENYTKEIFISRLIKILEKTVS